MRIATICASLAGALVAAVALPAWAETTTDTGRFTMSPTEGGVIRLDRETGAMSFCSGKEGEWSCKPMPETESELKKKVEDLEAEKKALEAERRLREGLFGSLSPRSGQGESPAPGEKLPPAPPADLPMPNERDVDKVFDYVEGMMKKLKERIERLEKEANKEPDVPL